MSGDKDLFAAQGAGEDGLPDVHASVIFKPTNTVSVTKVLIAAEAYAAGDVLSEATTNATGTTWKFTNLFHRNGGKGKIIQAQIISETTNVTPRLVVRLYNGVPTCELDDNAANNGLVHADLTKYLGIIEFLSLNEDGGDAEAIATPNTYGNLPIKVEAAFDHRDLHAVVSTRDAVTLDAGDDMTLILTYEPE